MSKLFFNIFIFIAYKYICLRCKSCVNFLEKISFRMRICSLILILRVQMMKHFLENNWINLVYLSTWFPHMLDRFRIAEFCRSSFLIYAYEMKYSYQFHLLLDFHRWINLQITKCIQTINPILYISLLILVNSMFPKCPRLRICH